MTGNKRKLPPWCVVWSILTLLTLLTTTAARMEQGYKPWLLVFTDYLFFWWPWIPVVLVMIAISRRFPFETHRWSALSIHFLTAFGWVIVFSWIMTAYQFLNEGSEWGFVELWRRQALRGLVMIFILYFLMATMVYMVSFYGQMRRREREATQLQLRNSLLEKQLSDSQLLALQTQLQPHFLFNTLNSIAALLRKREVEGALEMLAGLSDLLRYVLKSQQSHRVSLREEMIFSDLYLEIQKIRFGDRLTVIREIDEAAWAVLVPNMVLNPLLENAICHGLSDRTKPGQLIIRAKIEESWLRLEVLNQGPPLGDDWRPGIGLGNTENRLKNLYNDQFQFVMENTGFGVAARLKLPAKFYDAEVVDELN